MVPSPLDDRSRPQRSAAPNPTDADTALSLEFFELNDLALGPSVASPPKPGDLVAGKYLLTKPLGEGGMATVWQARDMFQASEVALKLLHNDPRLSAEERSYLRERLTREATALSTIDHPAVVRIFGFGVSSQNEPWLAMELLEGESFRHLLDERQALLPELAVQMLLPVAHGLAVAHELGVVHRDLKPDNLVLAVDGVLSPKVVDFGLAKLTRSPSQRKLTGIGLMGTPEYMAPEQALEKPDVDHRADIFAFCTVLYEAVAGVMPFAGPNLSETLWAVVKKDPEPLTTFGIDKALWSIVARGLRKNPAERWPTMRALGQALSRWLLAQGLTVDITGADLVARWQLMAKHTARATKTRLRRSRTGNPAARGRRVAGDRLRIAVSALTGAAVLAAPSAVEFAGLLRHWIVGLHAP